MTTLVDTSASLAMLDADGDDHAAAKELWQPLVSQDAPLACTNYILVETFALAQRRLGMGAARTLPEDLLPVVVVDRVSFDAMRRLDIETAFAFDRHLADRGFSTIP